MDNYGTQYTVPQSIDLSSSQPTQQQGNWFTRLLPTVGGVVGGLAGAAVPLLGETGVSEIAGTGVGQGIGKGLENILTGNPWSKDVSSNALQGAAFGGVGKLFGMGLKGLGGAATGAGKAATTAAEQTAKEAEEAQVNAALKAAEKQKSAASIANFKEVKSASHNELGPNQVYLEKIGVDSSSPSAMNKHATTVLNVGDTKLKQVLATQPGADMTGWLDNAVKQYGLENSLSAGTSKFGPINIDKIAAAGGSSGESSLVGSNSALEDAVNGFLKSHPQYKVNDLNTGKMPLSDLRELKAEIGNQVSREFGNMNTVMGTNTEAKGNYNNLSKLYDNLTNTLASPNVNKAIEKSVLTPQEEINIRTALKDTPQAAEEIISGWNKAKSYQDVNELLKPATQMKNVSNEALNKLKDTRSTARGEREALGAKPLEGIFEAPSTPPTPATPVAPVTPPTPSNSVMQTIAGAHPLINTAIGASKLAKQLGTNPAVLKKSGSLLDRISKIAPSAVVGAGGLISAGADAQPVGGNMQNQSMQQGMQNQGQNQLATLLSTLTAQEQASPINFASSLGPVISALAPLVQKQNVGAGVAQNLAGAYQNAGGPQGPISGAITNLSSFIPGTPANTYQRQQQATASTLASLLGISPQQAMQMLPQITQSAGTATPMMNNVQGLLGSYGG